MVLFGRPEGHLQPVLGQVRTDQIHDLGGVEGPLAIRMSRISLRRVTQRAPDGEPTFSAQESCAEMLTVALGPGGAGAVL